MINVKPVITVVDARMGRGKSSSAIRYMSEEIARGGDKKFIYITPFLSEVVRVKEQCGFLEPTIAVDDPQKRSKSLSFKSMIKEGGNITTTHSLFYLLDIETAQLIKEHNYTLIVDEALDVARRINISAKDFDIVCSLVEINEEGKAVWIDAEYNGKFDNYKQMSDRGALFVFNHSLMYIYDPDIFRAFKEIYFLTYMHEGQYQTAYLQYFELDYKVVGVKRDDRGFYFSDAPDDPEAIDYSNMINMHSPPIAIDTPSDAVVRLDKYHMYSKSWYTNRSYESSEIRYVRNYMRNYFRKKQAEGKGRRLWTCYKDHRYKLLMPNKMYNSSFLQISARASNEYRDRNVLAYMSNRFADPNVVNFFASRDIFIDKDAYALSEMMQWVWRSSIRDNKPIDLLIISHRMKSLLSDWIKRERER